MREDMPGHSEKRNPIETLRDAVRLRPGMYFGTLGPCALYEIVCCALDHAVDAAVHGTCNRIGIVLEDNQRVSIQDNGLGIPLETDSGTGQPFYQISPLEKPGKLNWLQRSIQAARISLGLPVVNAICSRFEIKVKRNGYLWRQQFAEGRPLSGLESVRSLSDGEMTGTEITLVPDFSILDRGEFDYTKLSRRMRELAYLVPGLTIALLDKRSGANNGPMEFTSKAGVSDFVRHLNRDYEALHEPIALRKTVELKRGSKSPRISGTFDIALQYASGYQPVILSFMNGVEVEYGGPHIRGLMEALRYSILDLAAQSEPEEALGYFGYTEDDCTCGLAAVLSQKSNPLPEGVVQGKGSTVRSRYYGSA